MPNPERDFRRALLLVLDGVGCGDAPDALAFGDAGSNTLVHIADARGGLQLPNLEQLGLGRIVDIRGVAAVSSPAGAWGVMQPRSPGKDSTTGHWELAGLHLGRPFPTYPNGFPAAVVDAFAAATGRPVIGNIAASGTDIIAQCADEQQRTGAWIVYTSADSVFQVAAHEEWIGLDALYGACETARALLVAPHDVSRVIARPFIGSNGQYTRTANRRDFSLAPPGPTLLDALAAAGVTRCGVGKVDDLFAGRAISARHTLDNAEGIAAILEWFEREPRGFCLANLVDFDTHFGHRNDVDGFAEALEAFDRALPLVLSAMREDDLLFITADHGNDPTTPSTDHSREQVPLLVAGPRVVPAPLGVRSTFSDVAATIAAWFRVPFPGRGSSFLPTVVHA